MIYAPKTMKSAAINQSTVNETSAVDFTDVLSRIWQRETKPRVEIVTPRIEAQVCRRALAACPRHMPRFQGIEGFIEETVENFRMHPAALALPVLLRVSSNHHGCDLGVLMVLAAEPASPARA